MDVTITNTSRGRVRFGPYQPSEVKVGRFEASEIEFGETGIYAVNSREGEDLLFAEFDIESRQHLGVVDVIP